MLTAENICKQFSSFNALDDVSFNINKGEIVGFLGKNGAGKTTLMRILTSYLSASSGTVKVDGDDVAKHSLKVRQKIGYLPEQPPLYNDMTVQNYLKFAAQIKDVPANQCKLRVAKVLEECDLQGAKHKKIKTLSKGFRQRVGIAQAIIHEPKLLILDEPTSGLDPIQIQQVLGLIKSQREQRTVLVSSHTLSDIEHIAHRVLMIKSGKIILDSSLDELLNGGSSDDESTLAKPSTPLTLEQAFIHYHADNVDRADGLNVRLPEASDE